MARHFLEDVALSAVGPWRLADHPCEEEHLLVQGQQGAAGPHGTVSISPRTGAAHFIGHQIGMSLQTVRQAVIWQMIERERALERRCLRGFFPPSDDGREGISYEDALCKVSLGQARSKHVSVESDAIAEFDQSQVVVRTPFHIARVHVRLLYIPGLLRAFEGGAPLACGRAFKTRQWGWRFSNLCTPVRAAVNSLELGLLVWKGQLEHFLHFLSFHRKNRERK